MQLYDMQGPYTDVKRRTFVTAELTHQHLGLITY